MSNLAIYEAYESMGADNDNSTNNTWQTIFRPGLFKGKVALVTGGGTGIGYAITKELATLGCTVVIASRNHDRCVEAAKELNAELKRAKIQPVGTVHAGPSTSIRDEKQIKELVKFVITNFGALDLLVNNAGGQFLSPAEDINRKGFAAVVETNLVGTFLVCREAYTQYMRDNGGSIVNITLGNRNGTSSLVSSSRA